MEFDKYPIQLQSFIVDVSEYLISHGKEEHLALYSATKMADDVLLYNPEKFIIAQAFGTGMPTIFPILKGDNMEDLVSRYAKLFPAECAGVVQLVKESSENAGWGKMKLVKLSLSVPTSLHAIMEMWQNGFWKDEKNVRRFESIAPKFAPGRS